MKYASVAWLLVVVTGAAACSNRDALSPRKDPTSEGDTDTGGDDDEVVRPLALDLASSSSYSLEFGGTAQLKVKVRYVDNGDAIAGKRVIFSSSGASASLSATQVDSDANGFATVTLTAGNTRGTTQIVASTEQFEGAGADPQVTFSAVIDGDYFGDLKVKYTYGGPVPVAQVVTRVHSNSLACGTIPWPIQPAGLSEQLAPSTTSTLTFAHIVEGAQLVVTARALSAGGELVAVGCVAAPTIVGQSTVTATVPLVLRDARFSGTYEFGATLHLDEALPPNIAGPLAELDNLFSNPDNVLAEQLIPVIADATGQDPDDLADALALTWFIENFPNNPDIDGDGEVLDDAMREWVLTRLPAWVNDGFTVGADITSLFTEFRAGGMMTLGDLQADGTVAGHWDWSDFAFSWRLGCDATNACCGERYFSGSEIGLNPIGADFVGEVALISTNPRVTYSVEIPEHTLGVQYGAIALYLIENVLLSSITGQDSLECAFESVLGCETDSANFVCGGGALNGDTCGCGRAGAILGDVISGLGTVGTALCVATIADQVSGVREQLLAIVDQGSENDHLDMAFSGTLADTNFDMATDVMAGDLTGVVVTSGNEGDFTGELYAERERQACDEDLDCGTGGTCGDEPAVLTPCGTRSVCAD